MNCMTHLEATFLSFVRKKHANRAKTQCTKEQMHLHSANLGVVNDGQRSKHRDARYIEVP